MTGILARLPRPRRYALLLGGSALAAVAYFSLGGERAEVARVERGELRQAVVASGRVRTPQRVEVASQITGRVTSVAVREGDTVTAGQVLLQFDAAEWQASVAQAKASLAQAESRLQQIGEASLPLAEQSLHQAEANARQAERQYQRVGELVAKGFYSPAQLDDAQRARDVAASQLQAAQIQAATTRPQGSEVRRKLTKRTSACSPSARTLRCRPMPTRASTSRPRSATSRRRSTPCAARSKSAWPWPNRRPPCATK